jgi:SAM-dependent methyltransferase
MIMKEHKTSALYREPKPASAKRGMPIAEIGASLVYWLAAHSYFLPGLYLQRYSTLFGLSLAAKRRPDLPRSLVYRLLNGTLESTNYFEFDFAWRILAFSEAGDKDYLDVLSPWLLPLLLMQRRRISRATVVNPNSLTVQIFGQLLDAAGLGSRCEILGKRLEECSLASESFDVITSISGPAQVKNDSTLLGTMWTLVKPGGRLIISLPCTVNAAGRISHHDGNEEESTEPVLSRPRIYDPQLLQERIFSVLGEPTSAVVYGETTKRDLRQPRGDALVAGYPHPREPLAMARDWRCFSRVQDLPGQGVIAMAFNKAFAS